MAEKYFLYSDEQITEKNNILSKFGKKFFPGSVSVNGRMVKFTQLSDKPDMPRFVDTKIVASGDISKMVYKMPYDSVKTGN